MSQLHPSSRLDRRIAALVCVATFAVLLGAARTQGNTRDEGYYFDAAELYWGWYGELGENLAKGQPARSFARASVDRWFSYNHEHPALMKTLFGASWRALHRCSCPTQAGRHATAHPRPHATLGLLSEEAALRLPTHLLVALMAAAIYLLGARAWSRPAGLAAAVMAVGAPRLFFDAQLAAFDAPIAALWVLTVYAYWRALDDRRWGWRAGVIFGLALATKHNAFFLPPLLVLHWLWHVRGDLLARRWPALPRVFLWMGLLGPLVYLACWPWLWFDTVARFREYVAFHVHHVYYNMEYLGRNYNQPPFPLSFPYLMTLFTLPATTTALALGGAARLLLEWRRQRSGVQSPTSDVSIGLRALPAGAAGPAPAGLLVAMNALFPMAILTITRAPIFGATKHFHAAIPFIALLAGAALHALASALFEEGPRRRMAALALAALAMAPTVVEAVRAHPYGLTHYTLPAGGPAGAADLGMNRQFWGYATRGLLPWIDAHALPGAPIYWHDTNQAQLNMHVREGRLRADLRNTGLEEPGVRSSDLALVIHEMHFRKYEYWIWDFYGTTRPSVVLDHEGVPIVTLYQRPQR